MDFVFENQGTNTYLVYEIGSNERIDSMSLGMLTNNKITGLASALFTQLDSAKYIKYNVSSKIAVKQFFSGPVNKKRLIGVFLGIVNAMLSAEEYMIDPNNILLDMDYIFADVSTCDTVLICLPVIDETKIQVELGTMFKNIVFNTQFDRTENCDYVAKLINYLNSMPVFSLVDFREVLNEINENEVQNNNIVAHHQNVVSEIQRNPQPNVIAKMPQGNQQRIENVQPVFSTPQNNQPVRSVESKDSQQVFVQNKIQAQSENNSKMTSQIAVPKSNINTAEVQQNSDNEKKIGLFGLLTHYNKENAQIYKEQKQKKKNVTSSKKQMSETANYQQTQGAGFAIPGQPVPQVSQPSRQPEQDLAPMAISQSKDINASQAVQPQQVVSMQPSNFGETTVLGGGIGETTVLGTESASSEQVPHLIRVKNNEKILVDKPVFRIGKEKSYVDYFIGDNTAISRSHANIITRDGEYFIVDTNSTNHTYINGNMIQSSIEIKLSHGTKIRLSNEDFEFKLY